MAHVWFVLMALVVDAPKNRAGAVSRAFQVDTPLTHAGTDFMGLIVDAPTTLLTAYAEAVSMGFAVGASIAYDYLRLRWLRLPRPVSSADSLVSWKWQKLACWSS